jgi:tRNA G37 N-methylase Trm5
MCRTRYFSRLHAVQDNLSSNSKTVLQKQNVFIDELRVTDLNHLYELARDATLHNWHETQHYITGTRRNIT